MAAKSMREMSYKFGTLEKLWRKWLSPLVNKDTFLFLSLQNSFMFEVPLYNNLLEMKLLKPQVVGANGEMTTTSVVAHLEWHGWLPLWLLSKI